jgi:hypothetical protein
MSFDAWIVGYGLSRTIIPIFSVTEAVAYFSWAIVIAVDLVLLYRFFKNRIPLDQTLPYLERPPSHKT